ncbi:MAG: hypothetical protein WCC12_05690 [Anaerolineales bacterium]
MHRIHFTLTLMVSAILIISCSSPKPAPTQDNGAVFTQAFETALADLSTTLPAEVATQTAISVSTETFAGPAPHKLELRLEEGHINALAYSPDGRLLGGSGLSFINIWNLDSGIKTISINDPSFGHWSNNND